MIITEPSTEGLCVRCRCPHALEAARLVHIALNKDQRNAVLAAIRDARLVPEEFDCVGAVGTRLCHLPTGAYFVVEGVAGAYSSQYSAGDGPVEQREGLSEYRLMQQVDLWLAKLKRDIDTPDLWAELRRERELLAAASDVSIENTPFTPAEQEDIAEQIRDIKDYLIRTHALSEAQVARLDYLIDASGRVGRKDWFLMAASVILGYVVMAVLPQAAAVHVLGTLLLSVGHVLGGEPPPLGLPS